MTNETASGAMPEWQRGIDIETLRRFAGVFKSAHKILVFGAFGLVKERDIADAIDRSSFAYVGTRDNPAAVAIGKHLERPAAFTDFAGRIIVIPDGHYRATAFSCLNSAAGIVLLRYLKEDLINMPVWIEAFEEDEHARAALDASGLHYVATKIAAGSEIKGLYTNATCHPSPLHKAEEASLVVVQPNYVDDLCLGWMRDEVARADQWAQHYSSYNKRKSWTSFALFGYDPQDPTFIVKPAEMSKKWKEENPHRMSARPSWTTAVEKFPAIAAVATAVAGNQSLDRVRLMRLSAGGELSRHADVTNRDAGLRDGMIARLHIPIVTSDSVICHGWDKRGQHMTAKFPAGALCYLDQRGPHRIENLDDSVDRVHLVIDVRSSEKLRQSISAAIENR